VELITTMQLLMLEKICEPSSGGQGCCLVCIPPHAPQSGQHPVQAYKAKQVRMAANTKRMLMKLWLLARSITVDQH
jgi:hypothetical protein